MHLACPSRACVPALQINQLLFRVLGTSKTQSSRSILTGRHHQKFAVLAEFVRLWEVPDGSLRLVITASAENTCACVVVLEFFRPLPDISYQVHYTERACTLGVRVDRVGSAHGAALVGSGNYVSSPAIAPRIDTT